MLTGAIFKYINDKKLTGISQHGFRMGKSCLSYLTNFYGWLCGWEDSSRCLPSVRLSRLSPVTYRQAEEVWASLHVCEEGMNAGSTVMLKGLCWAVQSPFAGWPSLVYPTVYTPWSALFNFFIHDLDNRTKLTLSKYMYADTKLTGVADTPDRLLPLRGTTIGWRNGQTETSQVQQSAEFCTWGGINAWTSKGQGPAG